MEERLSRWLKTLKLNEDKISMGMGVVVVILVAGMVFRYFNQVGKQNQPEVSATNTDQLTPVSAAEFYVVRPGDDLGKIAEARYGKRELWQEIAKANKLTNPDLIEVGMKLFIPPGGEEIATEEIDTEDRQPTVGSGNNYGGTISGDKYVVQPGDLLWQIAVRAYGDGFRWVEIAKVNQLNDPDNLEPGLVLLLPR